MNRIEMNSVGNTQIAVAQEILNLNAQGTRKVEENFDSFTEEVGTSEVKELSDSSTEGWSAELKRTLGYKINLKLKRGVHCLNYHSL